MTVYHFTCDHGLPGIERDGLIKPGRMLADDADRFFADAYGDGTLEHRAALVISTYAWFTDLPDGEGITGAGVGTCLRPYRLTVANVPPITRWLTVAREHDRDVTALLHRTGMPGTWWVSTEPVPVAAVDVSTLAGAR